MKKIFVLILALLITTKAYADTCSAAMTGVFTAAQATKACGTLVAKNQASTITAGGLIISAGGLSVTGGVTIATGGLTLTTNSIIVAAGGAGAMGMELRASGTTLGIQEATASTACMGVATPNGNTPVAVSTTCAVTGHRVFYTRVGAITNMGTISTTTAPSGTGFSFASTSATDTLASSVVYLIVGEAS